MKTTGLCYVIDCIELHINKNYALIEEYEKWQSHSLGLWHFDYT
jgi:hypothetical protein